MSHDSHRAQTDRDVTCTHSPSASPLPPTHDGCISVSPHWFAFPCDSSTGYLEPIFRPFLQVRDDGVVPQVDEPGPEILNSNRAGQKEAGTWAGGGKADSRNGSWVPSPVIGPEAHSTEVGTPGWQGALGK